MEQPDVKIARLEQQMTDSKTQTNRIEIKVDQLISKVDTVTELRIEITALRTDLDELRKHRFMTNWLFPTLAAAAGAVLAILVSADLHK